MTAIPYHITQPERPFARTNRQIINQRAGLLREWEYTRPTIAEICCGDCQRQQAIYRDVLHQYALNCTNEISTCCAAVINF